MFEVLGHDGTRVVLQEVFGNPVLESDVAVLADQPTWRVGHLLRHRTILIRCIR